MAKPKPSLPPGVLAIDEEMVAICNDPASCPPWYLRSVTTSYLDEPQFLSLEGGVEAVSHKGITYTDEHWQKLKQAKEAEPKTPKAQAYAEHLAYYGFQLMQQIGDPLVDAELVEHVHFGTRPTNQWRAPNVYVEFEGISFAPGPPQDGPDDKQPPFVHLRLHCIEEPPDAENPRSRLAKRIVGIFANLDSRPDAERFRSGWHPFFTGLVDGSPVPGLVHRVIHATYAYGFGPNDSLPTNLVPANPKLAAAVRKALHVATKMDIKHEAKQQAQKADKPAKPADKPAP